MERLGGSEDLGDQELKDHPFFKGVDWEAVLNKKVPVPFKPKIKGEMEDDLASFDKFDERPIEYQGLDQVKSCLREEYHFDNFSGQASDEKAVEVEETPKSNQYNLIND